MSRSRSALLPVLPAVRVLPAVAILALALATAGCGAADVPTSPGDGGSRPPAEPPTSSAVPEPDLPAGVTTTPAGTQLALGETATVAWRVGADRQGAVDLTVLGVQPAPVEAFDGWRLDGAAGEVAPYFVTYAVENVGDDDLAAAAMPLFLGYGEEGALVAASGFAATFPPCPSTPLPSPFGPGAATEGCLVYLAPNDQPVAAVAFQATGDVEPVTWGAVAPR